MTDRSLTSLFAFRSPEPGTERADRLCQLGTVTIERIVSSGTQPPQSFCQTQDEWVVLLEGEAEMLLDGKPLALRAGDALTIPAQVPHEVTRTSPNALWLAVHVPRPPNR